MAYDMRSMDGLGGQGAIILYRNMKDTVRAQYAYDQGTPSNEEAPLRAYYGKRWMRK